VELCGSLTRAIVAEIVRFTPYHDVLQAPLSADAVENREELILAVEAAV